MSLISKMITSIIGAALIGCGSFAFVSMNQIESNMSSSETAHALYQAPGEQEHVAVLPDDFYVLLLGVDSDEARKIGDEAEEYSGSFRSDSIILAHINTETQDVSLCSFERDLETVIDGYESDGIYKLNAAYAFGGVPSIKREVEQLSGFSIPFYAVIDMDGMIDLVDSIGGVEVDVEAAFFDQQIGDGIEQPGLQHLSGGKAITYCRSRYPWPNGDFDRARHQREVIRAITGKVVDLDPLAMYGAVETMSKYVSTNFTLEQLKTISSKMRGFDAEEHLYSMMTPSEGYFDGTQYFEKLDEAEWKNVLKTFIANDGGAAEKEAAEKAASETEDAENAKSNANSNSNSNANTNSNANSSKNDLKAAENAIEKGTARDITSSSKGSSK